MEIDAFSGKLDINRLLLFLQRAIDQALLVQDFKFRIRNRGYPLQSPSITGIILILFQNSFGFIISKDVRANRCPNSKIDLIVCIINMVWRITGEGNLKIPVLIFR